MQDYFVQMHYFIKNRQNSLFFTTKCRNINFPQGWNFFKWDFSWICYYSAENRQNLHLEMWTFLVANAFKCMNFFCANMLLFHRKLVKLVPNYQNMNFSSANIFCLFIMFKDIIVLLKISKICYFLPLVVEK